jgi:hypothetical protein
MATGRDDIHNDLEGGMIRAALWTGRMLLPATLFCSGCASRPPVVPLAASITAEQCGAEVEGVDVRAWRQIQAEGFTFCAPASWSRHARHDRVTARRPSDVISVAWAAPDTAHRVIFAVPVEDVAVKRMQAGYTSCQQSSQLARRVGAQDVCVFQSVGSSNPPHCPNAYVEVARTNRRLPIANSTICPTGAPRDWAAANVTIVYGEPLVRATVFGSAEALAVAQTVRRAPVSAPAGR